MYQSLIESVNVYLSQSKAEDQIVNLEGQIAKTIGNIFVTGAGRSGLIGKFLAMRLMHIGYNAVVVGETTTPRINSDDLLIAITCSGETSTVRAVVEKARMAHARTVVITKDPDSRIAGLATVVIVLGETVADNKGGSAFPMGTLFEISTLIFLEGVIGHIILATGITNEEMRGRHSNLE